MTSSPKLYLQSHRLCPPRRFNDCVVGLTLVVSLLFANEQLAASEFGTLKQVLPKTVKLYGAGGLKNLASYGTGFFISPDGHILTVWNHILDTDQVTAVLDNGRRLPAEFVGGAGEAGLAVLKVEVKNAPHFDLSQVVKRGPGTPVLGFSNMFNVAAGDEPVSVMHGVVAMVTPLSARRGRFEAPYKGEVYIVDAITNNPGSAGGVLTTRDGQLLGIIGKELRDSRSNIWINYAIPLSDVSGVVQQLVRGEVITDNKVELPPVIQPRDTSPLGFRLVPNVVARTPAFINTVLPGSSAADKGLQRDDLIVLVNDELIQSCTDFYTLLQETQKGDSLRITVRRDQELLNVELIVPEWN